MPISAAVANWLLSIEGEVRESADATSEHAWNDMFLYPICQEKNTVPVIFLSRGVTAIVTGREQDKERRRSSSS